MRVMGGSKTRNLMGYAMTKLKEPAVKQITWNGSGPAVTKATSCAEIMKRKVKGLHQITKIRFKRIEEYWDPKMEGLERLKVTRDVPAITILLSKEHLDENIPGYQAPGSFDAFWRKNISNSDKNKLGSGGKTFKKGKSGLSDGAAVHTQSAKKQKRGDRRSGQSQMSQIELGAAQKGGQSQADRNVKPTSADSTQEESSKTKGSKGVKRKKNGKKTGKSPKPDVEMEVNQ